MTQLLVLWWVMALALHPLYGLSKKVIFRYPPYHRDLFGHGWSLNSFPRLGNASNCFSIRWARKMADLSDREIRRIFLSEDVEQIRSMQSQARVFREHYPDHDRWLDSALREILEGNRVAFGAFRTGVDGQRNFVFELVGSIILKANQFTKIVELKNRFIREDQRRKGHGEALYKKVADYCARSGFRDIESEVPSTELGTISFLHGMGFKITQSYSSPYATGGHVYKMAKSLPPHYVGDPFDISAFSRWLLGATFGHIHPTSDGRTFTFGASAGSRNQADGPGASLDLRGLAFIADKPITTADLESVIRAPRIMTILSLARLPLRRDGHFRC